MKHQLLRGIVGLSTMLLSGLAAADELNLRVGVTGHQSAGV
jgi:hypothetical protein